MIQRGVIGMMQFPHSGASLPMLNLTPSHVPDPPMRTTFTPDDDAAALPQNYAKAHSLRLGKAVSELIRRASAAPVGLKKKGDLWVVAAAPDTHKVRSQKVRGLIDDLS
jgi:hypothetical protein